MASEAIGHVRCPWCASKRMRVSLTSGGKVCVTCSACHFQGFARGALSDMSIRQAMTPAERAPAAVVAPPEPAQGMAIEVPGAMAAAVVPAAKAEPPRRVSKPQPAAEPAPDVEVPAEPAKKKSAWDLW